MARSQTSPGRTRCDSGSGCRINGYPLDYEKGVKLPAKTEGDIITYYAGAKFAGE